jgi:mannose-6-phosphate isomerase-like protein (cupin superfamily)
MALHKGEGWAVADLGDLGEGPGFRKIRRELDVSEMGVNAIVLPVGVKPTFHHHERQEEVYFVHRGEVEIAFGDGSTHRLGPGGLARVAAQTPRKLTALGDEDAVYVVFGAHGGYVGRDGVETDSGAA